MPIYSARNYGCRLRDFLWRDHRCVALENERIRVLVAAGKGADILEFLHKPTDTECLWQSPAGLQPREFRPSSPLETGHFREYFAGGWYEMLPNGPAPCVHRGARFGYHGEATLLPWDVMIARDEPERVSVVFSVRLNRIPLHVTKTLTLECGRPTLFVSEPGKPIERAAAGQKVRIELRAALNQDPARAETGWVELAHPGGKTERITVRETGPDTGRFSAIVAAPAGPGDVTASYGYLAFRKSARLKIVAARAGGVQ